MNRMPVAHFKQRQDAEPVHARLVQNGIPAEIHDELLLERFWFVSKPGAGARLEVPANQFERAHNLLVQWDAADGALRLAIRCPECRSMRVDYPQFTRKSIIPNLVMGALAALGGVTREYYCEDCHCTWPREGTLPPKLRAHAAPYYFIEDVEQPAPAPPVPEERHR